MQRGRRCGVVREHVDANVERAPTQGSFKFKGKLPPGPVPFRLVGMPGASASCGCGVLGPGQPSLTAASVGSRRAPGRAWSQGADRPMGVRLGVGDGPWPSPRWAPIPDLSIPANRERGRGRPRGMPRPRRRAHRGHDDTGRDSPPGAPSLTVPASPGQLELRLAVSRRGPGHPALTQLGICQCLSVAPLASQLPPSQAAAHHCASDLSRRLWFALLYHLRHSSVARFK